MLYDHLTRREREQLAEETKAMLDNISVDKHCPVCRQRYREKTSVLVNLARARYGLSKVFDTCTE